VHLLLDKVAPNGQPAAGLLTADQGTVREVSEALKVSETDLTDFMLRKGISMCPALQRLAEENL